MDVIVYGKGAKERETYPTAASCMHLKEYLDSQTDDNDALFVGLKSPHKRLTVSGVEEILGHVKLDTMMIYCQVNRENVRHSHRKFMSAKIKIIQIM